MSHLFFIGGVSSRACSGAPECCTGIAHRQEQHTLRGNVNQTLKQKNYKRERERERDEQSSRRAGEQESRRAGEQESRRSEFERKISLKHHDESGICLVVPSKPKTHILAEGAIALSVTHSGGALFAS